MYIANGSPHDVLGDAPNFPPLPPSQIPSKAPYFFIPTWPLVFANGKVKNIGEAPLAPNKSEDSISGHQPVPSQHIGWALGRRHLEESLPCIRWHCLAVFIFLFAKAPKNPSSLSHELDLSDADPLITWLDRPK